ncbi:hypothetical protein [Tomitella biformata]|uniref:hypothetical protein n=1 Tax=Tomitella biformata TaxID=630403 RepID=UPI0004675605|nr:hypothetical protein [Tomitella biformata]
MTASTPDLHLAKALSDVVAVAHARDGRLAIWHVDVGPDNGLARMAGAWVVSDELDQAATLLRGRRVLATAEARAAIEELDVPIAGFLDPDTTLAGIGEETDRLQEEFEAAMAGRKTKLVNPSWPTPPDALEVADGAEVAVALGMARWLEGLAKTWEKVEAQRVTRKFLAPELGRDRRSLPVQF